MGMELTWELTEWAHTGAYGPIPSDTYVGPCLSVVTSPHTLLPSEVRPCFVESPRLVHCAMGKVLASRSVVGIISVTPHRAGSHCWSVVTLLVNPRAVRVYDVHVFFCFR